MMDFFFYYFRHKLGNIYKRLNVYRHFGFILPEGAKIQNIVNIKIGKNFGISENCQLYAQTFKDKIEIGDNVSLNHNVMINADGGGVIRIGNNVLIGPGTVIRASNHNFHDKEKLINQQGHSGGVINVEDDVWIGANCTILPDITISQGSVIGAGSVVTKDVAAFSIFGGVPAKFIKKR